MYDAALTTFRECYALQVQDEGPDTHTSLSIALNLCSVLSQQGHDDESEQFSDEQRAVARRALGAEHTLTFQLNAVYAQSLWMRDHPTPEHLCGAIAVLEKIIWTSSRVLGSGSDNPVTPESQSFLYPEFAIMATASHQFGTTPDDEAMSPGGLYGKTIGDLSRLAAPRSSPLAAEPTAVTAMRTDTPAPPGARRRSRTDSCAHRLVFDDVNVNGETWRDEDVLASGLSRVAVEQPQKRRRHAGEGPAARFAAPLGEVHEQSQYDQQNRRP